MGMCLCVCICGDVIAKHKESTATATVPGRTQNNGELNGVLNGKSSVFSHRFNVIAALTPLHSYFFTRCCPPPSLFTPVLCFRPTCSLCQIPLDILRLLFILFSLFFIFHCALSFSLSLPPRVPPSCVLPHPVCCRPQGHLIYRGQFSASCSQWAIWACNVSPCTLTPPPPVRDSKCLSAGLLH